MLGLGIPQTGVQGLGPGGVGPGGKAAKPGKAPVPGECGGLKLYVYVEICMIIDQLFDLVFLQEWECLDRIKEDLFLDKVC